MKSGSKRLNIANGRAIGIINGVGVGDGGLSARAAVGRLLVASWQLPLTDSSALLRQLPALGQLGR